MTLFGSVQWEFRYPFDPIFTAFTLYAVRSLIGILRKSPDGPVVPSGFVGLEEILAPFLEDANLRVESSGFHDERSRMKIHLRQIPQGGTLHLEGAEDPVSLGLEEIGARPDFASPLFAGRRRFQRRDLCHRATQSSRPPDLRGLPERI